MMFSYRLVRLIESHADVLAAGLEEKVQGSLQVTHFRDISAHELRERVYEIYRHLGEWLLGKNELDIEHRYREIGSRRAQQKVPISEVVQAIVLTKENLWEFLKSEFYEMPSLMARICGICPVSHLIASAKACDSLLAVKIPPTADKLRRIFGLAQVTQSYALSLFHLSSPDLLMGMDADPAKSNIFGVAETNPELALDGIRLRQFGQRIIERRGGKRIHPAWVVPGCVSEPLTEANRDAILFALPDALAIAERTLEWFKSSMERFREEISTFGNFPTLFMGIVKQDNGLTFYGGKLRIVDAAGNVVADNLDPNQYYDYIGEKVEPWSYLKSSYYKPKGFPDGVYRVGPLARLNVADRCGTPRADQELAEFHELQRTAVLSSFHYHHARLIEILYCIERLEQLLNDPEILSKHVRAVAGPNALEGVGAAEAPRGTLFHHYKIDEHGLIRWVNLIIATGQNNLAMNRSVLQVAKHYVHGDRLTPGMLNRVEAVIRCYDPCLSCSTHAFGEMPLRVQLLSPSGEVLDEVARA